ncbi:hypothetical protein NQZ79_g3892 [Umbelopsis isabellina]|nr:hypothetical protein NQZ79_g3892 [Umbelopsis isabellina]
MAALSSSAGEVDISSNDDWKTKDNTRKPWYSLSVSSGLMHLRTTRIAPASPVDTESTHATAQSNANTCCHVSFNSPCIVAGDMLKGRIHFLSTTDHSFDDMRALHLELIGIEEVMDNTQGAKKVHSRVFLQQEIEDWEYIKKPQYGQPFISFRTTLPAWLGGSYNDQYSKVYYAIRGIKIPELGNDEGSNRILEKEVVVRAKADQLTETDRELYISVSADNSISSSKYGGEHISDVKVVLLQRQNTYSQSNQSFLLMSVQSFSEVTSSSSITSLGYMQGITTGQSENFILGLNTSATQLTVKNQMLIDVSYAIQASITSNLGEEVIVEIPITLVHSESVEPPVEIQSYRQMVTRSTFSDLLNRTCAQYEDSDSSSYSDSDSESDDSETEEIITPERCKSIFQQRASFSIYNPMDPEPSATLRRTTLSCQELKQQANISRKVNVVQPSENIISTQEGTIERTEELEHRASVKVYNVRKAAVEDVAINVIEPNRSQSNSLNLSKQGNYRLNARHRLKSFRNNFRV